MSTKAAGFEVKGWCPGALRPMESGDGLIVRIRPRGASLGLAEMRGIADAAERHGNGYIDLTRRANLQIRGVSEATLPPLLDALSVLGLLDEIAEAEGVRNILVSPLAGIDPTEILDMRPLASALADMLAAEPETWALPGKFAFVLDGGGRLPLSAERADLRLLAIRESGRLLVGIGIVGRDGGTEWLGAMEPDGRGGETPSAPSRRHCEPEAKQSTREHGASGWIASAASPSRKDDVARAGWRDGAHRCESRSPAKHMPPARTEGRAPGIRGEGESYSATLVVDALLAILQRMIGMVPEGGSCRPAGLGDATIMRIKAAMAPTLRPTTVPPDRLGIRNAPLGAIDMGDSGAVLGLGVPFGGLEAAQLRGLADEIDAAGGDGIRLSPWRAFYIPLRDEAAMGGLAERARTLGFVVDAGDPLMRVQACPGHPACRSAHAETRDDARRIATWMAATRFPGTAHLSGCAKGCASSAPASLMLVGVPGGYRFLRGATARADGGVLLTPADIAEGWFHG